MKQKCHILHFFLALSLVCFITGAPTELVDIYIVDEADVYSVILEFNNPMLLMLPPKSSSHQH